MPFETAANGSTRQLIDRLSFGLRMSNRRPLTGSAEAKEGQITGGYVHDVEAGLHPWIAVLDFKSMYPSIMIGHNIYYTRYRPGSTRSEEGRYHISPIESKFRLADDRRHGAALRRLDKRRRRAQSRHQRSESHGDETLKPSTTPCSTP